MHNMQMYSKQTTSGNSDNPVASGSAHNSPFYDENQKAQDPRQDSGSPNTNCWTCYPFVMIKFQDPQPIIRQQAALRLAQFRPDDVIEPLCQGLQDPSILVQMGCIMSLQRILDPRAVGPLVEALRKTTSETIRYTIIDVLGLTGDISVIPEITPFLTDPSLTVQKSAVFALRLLRWS